MYIFTKICYDFDVTYSPIKRMTSKIEENENFSLHLHSTWKNSDFAHDVNLTLYERTLQSVCFVSNVYICLLLD